MSPLGNQSEDEGMAAEALADLRDEQAVPVLIATLGDAAVEVRFCATFALGELGDKRALPPLRQLPTTDEAAYFDNKTVSPELERLLQT